MRKFQPQIHSHFLKNLTRAMSLGVGLLLALPLNAAQFNIAISPGPGQALNLGSVIYTQDHAVGLGAPNETGQPASPASGNQIGGGITYDDVTKVLSFEFAYGSDSGFNDLVSDWTLTHLHAPGAVNFPAVNTSGGVIHNLASFHTPGSSARTGSFSGSVVLTAGQEADLFDNEIYINIHSASFGSGEIRGQLVPLTASPLIYEPFNDLDSTLADNTPGLGLDGTWSAASNVADTSLTYGILGYQGGRVVANPSGGNFQQNNISPGTTLTAAGLMDDGAILWFSVLIVNHADTSVVTNDRRTYFSIGTDYADGFDRVGPNDASGEGFLVSVSKASGAAIRAQAWTTAAVNGATDTSVAEGDTFLAVGKITWGEFGVTDDTFELYLPDKDLNLGSPVSTVSADFDQLGTVVAADAFDTISCTGGRKENNVPEFDEIRFGVTSADVLPLDFTAPIIVTTDNASGSSVERVATFDEELYVGAGDIRIVNETTPGTTTITLPDPQVVLSGNTLTITPTVPLGGDTYHIEIDTGALTDRNLNDFGGLSDPDLWEFTVDDTPPTVTSFGDNTFPLPILTNSSTLIYTVTFDEPMDPGTVEIADFAASAGSVPITVDSVSATGNPAVFEVGVTMGGTTGTLTLEIVASAVIADVVGNELDTTSAIPSDNTLTVNDPVANAGSITNDFQRTIASQKNALNQGGEGRYFHVSVNEDNPGTGWYNADLPGTGDPAPAGLRNFTGPVVAYKMLGNGGNGDVTSTAGSGGDDARITYETDDLTFGAFGQQQMRLWTTNDPGADLATGAAGSATGFASVGNYGYRDWQGATGIVDISGLASGSVHIYYGAYKDTPTVKVIMRDTDNVGADIVINDVHSVADGGNGDYADDCEYYLAEVDFVSDGVYDVIIYEWSSSNGRGLGTVLTGPDVVSTDYDTWAAIYDPADLSDPNGDNDDDGLTNDYERLFGLDPTSGSSVNPISVPLDAAAGTFSFTRRDPSLTGKFTDIETSFDLTMWTVDSGAMLTVSGTVDDVQTVDVLLSPGLLTAPRLFVRVNQNDGTVFSTNFEDDDGGFTLVGSPNDWEYGTPNTNNGAGLTLTAGNGGSTNCWATVLGTDSGVGSGGITASSDSILRSPDIDLTSAADAELLFAAAIDANTGDTLEVLVREVGTDALLETVNPVMVPFSSTDWDSYGPFAITAAAGKNVYLEFRFVGMDTDYVGFYIDDVTVQKVAP